MSAAAADLFIVAIQRWELVCFFSISYKTGGGAGIARHINSGWSRDYDAVHRLQRGVTQQAGS